MWCSGHLRSLVPGVSGLTKYPGCLKSGLAFPISLGVPRESAELAALLTWAIGWFWELSTPLPLVTSGGTLVLDKDLSSSSASPSPSWCEFRVSHSSELIQRTASPLPAGHTPFLVGANVQTLS